MKLTNFNRTLNTYQQALDAGMDLSEDEVFSNLSEALEQDAGGKIDISNLSWWEKRKTDLTILSWKIESLIKIYVLKARK